jgi:hypothetical protein
MTIKLNFLLLFCVVFFQFGCKSEGKQTANAASGKYLAESAMADLAQSKEARKQPFKLKDFFDQLMAMGNIPAALGRWEMTGNKGQTPSVF